MRQLDVLPNVRCQNAVYRGFHVACAGFVLAKNLYARRISDPFAALVRDTDITGQSLPVFWVWSFAPFDNYSHFCPAAQAETDRAASWAVVVLCPLPADGAGLQGWLIAKDTFVRHFPHHLHHAVPRH